MTAWTSPRIRSIADAYSAFVEPPASTHPTPFFWWSGADLSRPRLEWELDQLKNKGIGGTIVGYSHLPDGRLDHGDPAPFTEEWWELFRWFVDASADRGMTTGIQDYGVIGTVLKSVAPQTSGLNAGTLSNVMTDIEAGEPAILDASDGQIISAIAWPASLSIGQAIALDPVTLSSPAVEWEERTEPWHLSAVVRTRGKIGLDYTDFDPLHPDSGAAVIDTFYANFQRELGDLFGTSFRTFFQDELDLGITMPMWNDAVAEALSIDFPEPHLIHALWHDLGECSTAFRSRYRDTIVDLLVSNYFRPIYEWLDARGVLLVMDQISRGDLRLGHTHYADFMETMQWYHGPGNDDPDLGGPRGTAAFAISASIARAAERPLVVNEAFHSSGWAVTPSAIISGANVGFVSGANHLVMHGLNYTTEAGWWEWASPDFHFRQPWWVHSAPLWKYFARVSSILRCGLDAQEVAVLDPSVDLDLDPDTGAPEIARELLTSLRAAGLPALAISQSTLAAAPVSDDGLQVGGMPLRVIVLPGMRTVRDSTLGVLSAFVASGGQVIAVDDFPRRTESRSLGVHDTAGWTLANSITDVIAELRNSPAVAPTAPGLMVAHRRLDDADIFFIVNSTDAPIEAPFILTDARRLVESWDPWTGRATAARRSDGAITLRLEAGRAEVLVVLDQSDDLALEAIDLPSRTSPLPDTWTVEYLSGLANNYKDFALDERLDLGIETVRFTVENTTKPARADVGTRFFVLGPVRPEESLTVEKRLLMSEPDFETPIGNLSWRPYDFSPSWGIDDDPLQRDLMIGPHGLKGARDDFLDPLVLDPIIAPGSLYYFCSRSPTPEGSELLRAGSRARFTVWIDGRLAIDNAIEEPAAWYPPWSLRDLRITGSSTHVDTPHDFSVVLIKLTVSADQPTRGYVVLGGSETASPTLATMRWWEGSDPARMFQPRAKHAGSVRASLTMPPGSRSAVVRAIGPVVTATVNGSELHVVAMDASPARGEPLVVSTITIPDDLNGMLDITVRGAVDLGNTGGIFTSPIRWTTAPQRVPLASWANCGLADFSGRMKYTTTFTWTRRPGGVGLGLQGLVGSAEVTLNGQTLGILFDESTTLDLSGAVLDGDNVIEIECANTLGNYYGRWPTPYASTSDAGGGFRAAVLVSAELDG